MTYNQSSSCMCLGLRRPSPYRPAGPQWVPQCQHKACAFSIHSFGTGDGQSLCSFVNAHDPRSGPPCLCESLKAHA